jgi:hypothetical protein
MKIYIASSSKFINECQILATNLEEEFDFTITRKWWNHYVKDEPKFKDIADQAFYAHPQVQTINWLDFEAVREADAVVVITKDEYKLTGAMIELGYALALGKPVYILGDFKRSAMLASCIQVRDIQQLISAFRRFL